MSYFYYQVTKNAQRTAREPLPLSAAGASGGMNALMHKLTQCRHRE